jgi:hypothetical protein
MKNKTSVIASTALAFALSAIAFSVLAMPGFFLQASSEKAEDGNSKMTATNNKNNNHYECVKNNFII